MNVTITNKEALRELADSPLLTSKELYPSNENGHKFSVGDECTLTGLQDFPEFNGRTVEITAIREDGPRGKAYYIKGDINKFMNWVYEYRLI